MSVTARVRVIIDSASLVRTAIGTVSGKICLLASREGDDPFAFPSPEWYDLVTVIVPAWASSLHETKFAASLGRRTTGRFLFMEGNYSWQLVASRPEIARLRFMSGSTCVRDEIVSLADIEEELRLACLQLENEATTRRWQSDEFSLIREWRRRLESNVR